MTVKSRLCESKAYVMTIKHRSRLQAEQMVLKPVADVARRDAIKDKYTIVGARFHMTCPNDAIVKTG
jgi:hypothetical protein